MSRSKPFFWMENEMSKPPGRRRVGIAAVCALLAWATISTGCGGSGNPAGPAPSPPPAGSVTGTVEGNHPLPHRAVITAAQFQAGAALTLDIQGEANHAHTIALTATDLTQIAAGARATVFSSENPHSSGLGHHSHMVTFN